MGITNLFKVFPACCKRQLKGPEISELATSRFQNFRAAETLSILLKKTDGQCRFCNYLDINIQLRYSAPWLKLRSFDPLLKIRRPGSGWFWNHQGRSMYGTNCRLHWSLAPKTSVMHSSSEIDGGVQRAMTSSINQGYADYICLLSHRVMILAQITLDWKKEASRVWFSIWRQKVVGVIFKTPLLSTV